MTRRRFYALPLTALCLALGAGPAFAWNMNGFLRDPGKGDFAVSYNMESYDEFWAGEMETSAPPLGTVTNQSVSTWFALGLSDQVTVFGSVPWVHTEGDGSAGFSEEGMQDVTIMGAVRLARFGGSLSHTFVGAFGGRAPASSYAANLPVSIGDGTTDGLLRLVYQLQVSSFYLSQQVGYDVRSHDAPNGVPLYTEAGWTFVNRYTLNGWYAKYIAEDGSDIGDPGFTFPGNQEEFDRAGGKLYVRVNDWFGATAGGFTTLAGRNTGKSTGWNLGVNASF